MLVSLRPDGGDLRRGPQMASKSPPSGRELTESLSGLSSGSSSSDASLTQTRSATLRDMGGQQLLPNVRDETPTAARVIKWVALSAVAIGWYGALTRGYMHIDCRACSAAASLLPLLWPLLPPPLASLPLAGDEGGRGGDSGGVRVNSSFRLNTDALIPPPSPSASPRSPLPCLSPRLFFGRALQHREVQLLQTEELP